MSNMKTRAAWNSNFNNILFSDEKNIYYSVMMILIADINLTDIFYIYDE